MSIQAYQQLHQLQQDMHEINITSDLDAWIYPWKTKSYSSMKMYKILKGGTTAHCQYVVHNILKNCATSIILVLATLFLRNVQLASDF